MATMQSSTGLFVGSFDPFTIGHDNIVKRALQLFDHVVIGVGINPEKVCRDEADCRLEAIRSIYADNARVEVTAYTDLTIDLAARVGATCIVKGVRSVQDFEYERIQADLNKRLGGIETILLYAEPDLASVSSSAARELLAFRQDISWMLPHADNPEKP